MNSVLMLLLPLVALAQKGPDPEDVKAGWLGFAVFLLLAAAVAFLGFSLHKHLGRVDFEEQDSAEGASHDDASHDGVSADSDSPEGDRPPAN